MIAPKLQAMLGYISIAFLVASTVCSAQVAYSRVVPFDPRYIVRRIPVRRSAEPEPRIRLPITRYFPQVDTQVAPAPYYAPEAVAPAAYRVSNGEVYAIPNKWTDEVIPLSALERNEDNDYDAYEYDGELNPAYGRAYPGEFAVAQEAEPQDLEGDLYNDLMVNYLLGEMQPSVDGSEMVPEVQRRSGRVQEAGKDNQKQNDSRGTEAAPSSTPPSAASQPASSTPAVPKKPTTSAPQVRMPAAPKQTSVWRDYGVRGQKEYPLYRPLPASPMASLENKMSRAKNSAKNKDALPLIEKMMSAVHRNQDPLQEQLDNLKYRNM